MEIKLKLIPMAKGSFLTVQKENGSIVEFSEPDEATEFMRLWFGLTDEQIIKYRDVEYLVNGNETHIRQKGTVE